MSVKLKPSMVLFHLVLLLSPHWITCLGLVAFIDSSISSDDSRDNLRQGSELVASPVVFNSNNSIQQVSSVVEDRMEPNSEKIALLVKASTSSAESTWKAPFKVFYTALQRLVHPVSENIDNPDKANALFMSMLNTNGLSPSEFGKFEHAVMKGYEKAGLETADASFVVVGILTKEIGHWGASKFLSDLAKVNAELSRRTRSSLYRYWDQLQLSLSEFEAGKITSSLKRGVNVRAVKQIIDCFSEYFKYADQVVGREENSAYKALKELLENLNHGDAVDYVVQFFSKRKKYKLFNEDQWIALEYLERQYAKYNTPALIIESAQFAKDGLYLLGRPYSRLNFLCDIFVKVDDRAEYIVEKQAKWLIDQLADWIFDKKLFLIMYPMQDKDELAASVLKQLRVLWKNDKASSIGLALDFIKSMLQNKEPTPGAAPYQRLEFQKLKGFIDLVFEKPIPNEIAQAFSGQNRAAHTIALLNEEL